MFTGIITEIGRIAGIQRGANSVRLEIAGNEIFSDLKLGDSISTNGVCLTVSSFSANVFTADVMPETLKRSNLGKLQVGHYVNLEPAMPANGRFGGHIVSGHIDGTGTILQMKQDDNAILITIHASSDLLRYVILKGSITIDGISLTVSEVTDSSFSVSIIPHTAAITTLGQRKVGDVVNLEVDILGKYIEKLLLPKQNTEKPSGLTSSFLAEHGFGG